MASESSIPSVGAIVSDTFDNNGAEVLGVLVKEATEKMPIALLRRLIAAKLSETCLETRQRLVDKGYDVEKLRSEFQHMVSFPSRISDGHEWCDRDRPEFVAKVNKFLETKIVAPEGIICIGPIDSDDTANSEYGFASWYKTEELYVILKPVYRSDGSVRVIQYMFEVSLEVDYFSGEGDREKLRMKILPPGYAMNLYEMLAVWPELYEKICWTFGGPKGILEALKGL